MDDQDGTQRSNNRRGHIPAACVRFIEKLQGNAKQPNPDANKYDSNARGIYRATWVIAAAGILTFGAALIQAYIFSDQLRAMRSTDGATHIAAEAAKQSADAVASIERPYFFILAKIPHVATKEGPFNDIATPKLTYQIINLGRVPGILRVLYVRCFLQAGPFPEKPVIDGNRFRTAQSPIAAGLTSSDYPCDFDAPFTEQDWRDIAAGKKTPIFMAVAMYESALDYTYASTATYAANLFEGQSYAVGNANYNADNGERGRITKGLTASIPNIIWGKTDVK
jgi:hypothetical protein